VRTDLQFDDAHIPAAVCIPAVQAGFGTRLAWLAERDEEIVLVGRDDEDARRAAKLALSVGIRKVGGHLGRRHDRVAPRAAPGRADRADRARGAPRARPVRLLAAAPRRARAAERDEGYIPDSLFEPWHDIDTLPDGLDPERPVTVLCASGQRAAVAVQRFGAKDVILVVGRGVPKWGRLGHPIEAPEKGTT
jgi:hydroxyacylglutathione hydrolase